MKYQIKIQWVPFFVGFILSSVVGGAESDSIPLLRDGHELNAVDGTIAVDGQGTWYFTLAQSLIYGRQKIPRGVSYELLPCTTLESLIKHRGGDAKASYRLWARITRYRSKNYLMPFYFYPQSLQDAVTPTEKVNDPNQTHQSETNAIGIPAAVWERMQPGLCKSVGKKGGQPVLGKDQIVLGRRGRIVSVSEEAPVTFVFEGVGRSAPKKTYTVLPSQTLETMERQQAHNAQTLIYRVSGFETRYQGKSYLLFHQAVRIYGYGNLD